MRAKPSRVPPPLALYKFFPWALERNARTVIQRENLNTTTRTKSHAVVVLRASEERPFVSIGSRKASTAETAT